MTLLRRPFWIWATWKASKKTMKICDTVYGGAHHGSGIENAFRHALWNMLIGCLVYKRTKDVNQSIEWAQRITDMHEELFWNPPLEKAMDLHNNAVGRMFINQVKTYSETELVEFLKRHLNNAIRIKELKELEACKNLLVYIS